MSGCLSWRTDFPWDIKGKGEEKKMMLSESEMETILVMYRVVEAEGQESDTMVNLVGRIKKEKIKEKQRRKRSNG